MGINVNFLKKNIIIIAIAIYITLPVPSYAQIFNTEDDIRIDENIKNEIIDSVLFAINDIYIFPEVAKEMENYIRQQQRNNAYNDFDLLSDFSFMLTEDLRSICHDKHLTVSPSAMVRQYLDSDDLTDEERFQMRLERNRYDNFGFNKLERLPGNVGYIDLIKFADTQTAGQTAISAMNFLGNVDALIIDLRFNGGGSPSMIQLISSYFFSEPVHLNSFYIRKEDTTEQFWTQSYVVGKKMINIPLYILTSHYTFSAAEEFTYNLKNLERATIIGETTGGGAHPVNLISFENLDIAMSLPYGRAINPITGTNWEGVGVEPDIKTLQEDALDIAYYEAIKFLYENETFEDKKFKLEWTLKDLETKINPVILDESELYNYLGTYGPRQITIENGSLYYQRGENPKFELIPMGNHLFMSEKIDYFRIQFIMGSTGIADELIGLYDNGTSDKNMRSE